jgi:alkanesulfonate monooxygenase SsuD/methylene tetrahydromethanopterin reductase-like flavin-dependent oxidoreductase (luciferase family)
MYCAETEDEAEEGWQYYEAQQMAAKHHYFEWNNPGFAGVSGYEAYQKLQVTDLGPSGGRSARNTQPIGTPEQIIERMRSVQASVNFETLVLHVFYGGMPVEKAERSLRLFADKVLPEIHALDTSHPQHMRA